MFANLSVLAMNFALQGQWDLRTMWGTMGIIAKGGHYRRDNPSLTVRYGVVTPASVSDGPLDRRCRR